MDRKIMKKYFVLILLTLSINSVFADSPLTSTDFSQSYLDIPIVKEAFTSKGRITLEMMDYIDDDYFEKKIIKILKTNQIDIFPTGIKVYNYKALPDDLDIFSNKFIDPSTKHFINENLFKRRIVGLTSYFRSAKEELLPRYEKTPLYYHVLNIKIHILLFLTYLFFQLMMYLSF
jgi:hypothetical protein